MSKFEPLVGRLKWQRTKDGLRIVVPGRLNWGSWRKFLVNFAITLPFFVLLIATWTWMERRSMWGDGFFIACGLLTGEIVLMINRELIITIDPLCLTLESRSGGIKRGVQSFDTAQLRSMRCAPLSRDANARSNVREYEVQFQDHFFVTHSFATGLSEIEARALIAKVAEAFPFVVATEV